MARGWFRTEVQVRGRLPEMRRYIPQLLVAAAEMAKSEWASLASQKLHSTANEYMRGLEVHHYPNRSTVTLKGWLPNAMEKGKNSWDIKDGLLRSSKAKTSAKGGKYITVPMPLKAPGSGERGPSPPVMPWSIYKIVSRSPMGKSTQLPVRLENLGWRTRLSPDPTKWSPYTWKTSPFQGIKKSPDPARRGKARYNTFRRVSTNSDPSSWIHPGFSPLNLAGQVAQKLPNIIDKLFSDFINMG